MGKNRRDRTGFYRYDTPTHVIKGNGQPVVPTLGTCPADRGKRIFESRAAAKKVCKHRSLDHPVEPYRCSQNPDWWHVGGKKRGTEGSGDPA